MISYLEPVLFADSDKFLCGSDKYFSDYKYIENVDIALNLFFEQNIPSEFIIWNDFWIRHCSYILNHPKYKESLEKISEHLILYQDEKKSVKDRLKFLKLKKLGLINEKYINFKEKVADDVYEMLQVISAQRFIFEDRDPKLEEIFLLLKEGYFVCGVTKNYALALFNPIKIISCE